MSDASVWLRLIMAVNQCTTGRVLQKLCGAMQHVGVFFCLGFISHVRFFSLHVLVRPRAENGRLYSNAFWIFSHFFQFSVCYVAFLCTWKICKLTNVKENEKEVTWKGCCSWSDWKVLLVVNCIILKPFLLCVSGCNWQKELQTGALILKIKMFIHLLVSS